jgi:SGNH hydrolase-like domain, acetyltransferase AlgX
MHKLHKILFIIFLVLLTVPAIQKEFEIFKVKNLNGSFSLAHYEPFEIAKWFDGSFQQQYDKYLEDHIGLRTRFVRFFNTIDFHLFKKSHANGVLIGNNSFLFEKRYIRSALGLKEIDEQQLLEKVQHTKEVQDSLLSKGVQFLVITAPGKGWYYPEYIPKPYRNLKKENTHYEFVSQKFKVYGINNIDFNTLFLEMKDTVSYPLFPKCGVHWTYGSMQYVADSLINYCEKNMNIDLPDMIIDSVEYSKKPRFTDYDIGDALNINYKIPQDTLIYPSFSFKNDSTKTKPRLLVIGDSFYWTFYNGHFASNLFSQNRFAYYNNELHGYKKGTFSEAVRKKGVKNADIIMIWTTESQYHDFDMGFVDDMQRYFEMGWDSLDNHKIDEREELIQFYVQQIQNSAEWLEHIKVKAKENNVSLKEMLRRDAEYMVEQEENKNED